MAVAYHTGRIAPGSSHGGPFTQLSPSMSKGNGHPAKLMPDPQPLLLF